MKEIVPTLVEWLNHQTDLRSEVAVDVLMQIGGNDSIPLLTNNFFQSEDVINQLRIVDALRKLKTPESEQAILDLLEKEKEDLTIITCLANGLCELFSIEAIPLVKKLIDEDYYDDGLLDLKGSLYCSCMINDVHYGELEEWKEDSVFERADATTIPDLDLSSEEIMAYHSFEPQEPYVREEAKIGRNDPCPCGSGKKYKKCCGKNE